MTNNTRTAIFACLLLLAIIVGAYVKDATVPESIHKQPQDFRLADARKHYEENIENLCFPEIYLKPIIQTKGSNFFHNLNQTPLWNESHFSDNGWSYIYEIPILYNIPLKASIGFITREGRMIKQDKEVRLQTNLIIQKYKESGNVHIFLSTLIGYIPNPDNEIQGDSPWLWTGDRRNFTGYQFFTNTDGSARGVFHYRNARRTSITLNAYDKEKDYVYPQEAFSINLGSIGTKGDDTNKPDMHCWACESPMSSEDYVCPKCGAGPDELDEIIIIGEVDYCGTCGNIRKKCTCSSGNGGGNEEEEGDGDRCPYCLSSECSGECQEIGEGGTGESLSGETNNDSTKTSIVEQLFTFDSTSAYAIKPLLEKLYDDCFGSNVLNSFGYKISFVYKKGIPDMATCSSDGKRITWDMHYDANANMGTAQLAILEELIHAIQYKNRWIYKDTETNIWMNAEVEAKIAIYIYAKKNNCIDSLLRGYSGYSWSESIEPYLESPSQENYIRIVEFIRSMGG